MRKKIILFLLPLVLVLIAPPSLADSLKIRHGEYKEIFFEIENKNDEPLYYTIYTVGGFKSIIFYYSQILLQPNEHKYVKVIIFPGKDIAPGIYELELVAESSLDRITKRLKIEVLEREKEVNIKEFVFNDNLIKVVFDILEDYDLNVVIYKGKSQFQIFEKRITPHDNIFEKVLDLKSGNYSAVINVYKNNSLIYTEEKSYSKEFVSKISQERKDWDYLITYGSKIIFRNDGNEKETKKFVLYVNKPLDPFFYACGYKLKVDAGSTYKYVWEFTLAPSQSYIISYSFNYSILLVLIVALIFLCSMLYLAMRKEIVVRKFLMSKVTEIKEGKEIKICLEVINRTKEEINNLILEDFIPPIFELKSFQIVEPEKVYETKKEKKVVWSISRIEPKETRVFNYKIIPKVGVKGKYSFPLAKVKYKKDKITKIVFSNSLEIK
jgi:hypothetical protein